MQISSDATSTRKWHQNNKEVTLVWWFFFLGKGSQKNGNSITTLAGKEKIPQLGYCIDNRSIYLYYRKLLKGGFRWEFLVLQIVLFPMPTLMAASTGSTLYFHLYCLKTHQFHSNERLTNISIQVILYIYNLTMVVTNYTKLPHWTVQVISPIITCVSSQNTKLYGFFSLWGFQKSINCNTAESSVLFLFKSRFTSLKAGNNTCDE